MEVFFLFFRPETKQKSNTSSMIGCLRIQRGGSPKYPKIENSLV
jgi:hypothetical protein